MQFTACGNNKPNYSVLYFGTLSPAVNTTQHS